MLPYEDDPGEQANFKTNPYPEEASPVRVPAKESINLDPILVLDPSPIDFSLDMDANSLRDPDSLLHLSQDQVIHVMTATQSKLLTDAHTVHADIETEK